MEDIGINGNSDGESESKPAEPILNSQPTAFTESPANLTFAEFIPLCKKFLSLTGGSILYCLSALSIIYGISQVMGYQLGKSTALSNALPSIFTLNIYELSLLMVMTTIVLWRNVTDDAISLLILVGLFLIGNGVTLGVAAYHNPIVCIYIGSGCVILGLLKLGVMRKFLRIPFTGISFLGIATILIWNFLTSSIIAKFLMAREANETFLRNSWVIAWLILLASALIITIDAALRKPAAREENNKPVPLLNTLPMVWIFCLILLTAAGLHQYALSYMFVVDKTLGDFAPLISVVSILLIELMRHTGKKFGYAEILAASVPLAYTAYAVLTKSVTASSGFNPELLWHPPVLLGLTGAGIFALSFLHRWNRLYYVVFAYALGCILTSGFSPNSAADLNWYFFAAALVAGLFILGVIHKNIEFCFAAVLILSIGICVTDVLEKFARMHSLSTVSLGLGIGGIGIMALYLSFLKKLPKIAAIFGAFMLMVGIFDYLPESMGTRDLWTAALAAILCIAIWLRTSDYIVITIICIPFIPRLYMFSARMSPWDFIVLSFVLLFLGTAVSIYKGKKSV